MKRLQSALCFIWPKELNRRALITPDLKPEGGSMSDHRSSSDYGESFEEKPPESAAAIESKANQANSIIKNPDFSQGLQSWHANYCHAYVAFQESTHSGENYAVVSNRAKCWQGLEQDIAGRVSVDTKYKVSAFVRVHGDIQSPCEVRATLKLENSEKVTSYLPVGRKFVTLEKWEELEGYFVLSSSMDRVIFYLEGPPPGVCILIKSVAIYPAELEHSDKPSVAAAISSKANQASSIINNPDFSQGLQSWHANWCRAYVAFQESTHSGENYVVVANRGKCWQGLEQDITGRVSVDVKYKVSAFVRVHGDIQSPCEVQATLRLENSNLGTTYMFVGRKLATLEKWEELEGSFMLSSSMGRVIFYLEGPPPGVDLLIKSVAIYPAGLEHSGEESRCIPAEDKSIIRNSHFEDELNHWSGRGCSILLHETMEDGKVLPLNGKHFASASDRSQSWNGIQQDITDRVLRKIAYEVTAFVRLFGNSGAANVRATLWVRGSDGREQYISIGKIQASVKEWACLQGKFLLNGHTSSVVIYLEGPPDGVEILVDSLIVKRVEKLQSPPLLLFENVSFGINIIENSDLNQGLSNWSPLGSCTLSISSGSPRVPPPSVKDSIGHREPLNGRFIVTSNRTETWMGPSQTITDKLVLHATYQVAAWVRIGSGVRSPQTINVALGVDGRWVNGGQSLVSDGEWSEVVGSFRIEKMASKVMVYVQGPSVGVDLMLAGLHVFPVDRKARFDILKQRTDQVRKRDIILKFPGIYSGGATKISVKVSQMKNSFPFGSCLSRSNIENEEFVDFFVKNFNWAVFGNELKWSHTEPEQGKYSYSDADELLNFCEKHKIDARGHCIFWEVEDAVQQWVKSLDKYDLLRAVRNRLTDLLSRYKTKFRHYDVNNEMLHGSFYTDKLGENIAAQMFKEAQQLDPSASLFVNDYNVEDGCDAKASPEMYVRQIRDLQRRGAPVGGIGVQGHISNPVGQIVGAALDKLAVLGLPVWFTELDVAAVNEHVRAEDLEVVLREAFAHPAVEGIVFWGFWECFMCRDDTHLVEAEGSVNEAGRRYLALREEWLSHADGTVDSSGEFRFRGYFGEYALEVNTPWKSLLRSFVVEKGDSPLVLDMYL